MSLSINHLIPDTIPPATVPVFEAGTLVDTGATFDGVTTGAGVGVETESGAASTGVGTTGALGAETIGSTVILGISIDYIRS